MINVTGNRNPVWSGAPSTINAAAGATQSFASYVTDPDGDSITFSLVSPPSGYSITAAGVLTVGSTSQSVTIRATDGDGLSADSVCAITVTSSSTFKWNPGHYAETQTYGSIPDSVVTGSNGISTVANIKGVVQRYNWSTLEPTRGGYDFSAINADLAKLRPYGKRLVPLIMDRSWSGTSTSHLPSYLATEPGGSGGWTVKLPSSGVIANIWLAAIMDREIALSAALASAYDSEPLFEGIRFEEITPSYTGGTGYSNAAMIAQWKRLATAARGQWTKTNVFFNANTLGGVTGPLQIIEHNYGVGVSCGGPDVIPPPAYATPPGNGGADYQIGGDRVYTQNPDVAKGDNPALFLRDYRTLIPCMNSVQTPSLGGARTQRLPSTRKAQRRVPRALVMNVSAGRLELHARRELETSRVEEALRLPEGRGVRTLG